MTGQPIAVTDGGIETALLFREGFELPCFASFPLLSSERGREAIGRYFAPFFDLSEEHGLPFLLGTATWRANPDWGARLGYDADALAQANRDAVAFARELGADRGQVTIDGVLGPRGDGYAVGDGMTVDEAASYHAWQIGILREEGVEQITAMTLTQLDEAIGIVQAAADAGLAVIPSFTVETDGRLPDGTPVAEAIETVDAETGSAAAFFMLNCAYPTHIAAGLHGEAALSRIGGLRANASMLSHAELDEAEELDEGDPEALGRDNAALSALLPGIRVLGGCCGTDHRHVGQIISAWPTR